MTLVCKSCGEYQTDKIRILILNDYSLNRRGPNVKKQLIVVLVKEPDGAWNKSFETQVHSTAKF